jgi:hypothetical protein
MATIESTMVQIDEVTAALWRYQGEVVFREDCGRNGPAWTQEEMEVVVERVNRGALLLDEQQPGWEESILPQKLNMSNATFCIIGQAYGDYDESVGVPFGRDLFDTESMEDAVEHGFLTEMDNYPSGDIPYPLLDRVWVKLLQERNFRKERVVLSLPSNKPFNDVRKQLIDAKLLTPEADLRSRLPEGIGS